MYFDNKGRQQPKLPLHKYLLKLFDQLNEKNSKLEYISPSKLMTENRKDIEYRCVFLIEVIEKQKSPLRTLYSQFISDKARGFNLDSKVMTDNFIKLFQDIKTNGISYPLVAGRYDSKSVKTRHFIDGKKIWTIYDNKTGLQLIDGAHRLACALYLEIKEIPVRIYKPLSFEIPNYTDYIRSKEKDYLYSLQEGENGRYS